MELRAGTGISDAADVAEAGRAAATAAVEALGGEAPALVIVFACIRYDLPALLEAIRRVTGSAQLVGATSAGQFAGGQYQPMGTGVAVLALSQGPYRFGVASCAVIGGKLDAAGQQIARESRQAAGPLSHGALLLFTDWLIGNQQELIQGIYRVTGPRVPTVGGAAGDVLDLQPTLVFHDDRILRDAAVAVWISSEHPLTVVTRHGWEPLGNPLLVTRATPTEVLELAGKPARVVYEEQLGYTAEAPLTTDRFQAEGLFHPLAVISSDGSLLVRAVIGPSEEGGLQTIAQVPAGCAVYVTTGSCDSLLGCVPAVAEEALAARPGARVLLAFSCVARAMVCGDRIAEEPRLLHEAAGGIPTFGFYTYGEYARTRGVLGTHTATITSLAL